MITYKSNGSSYSVFDSITLNNGYGNVGFIPADVNGDGKTDIIQCWDNNGLMSVFIYKSTGSSFYSSWSGTMPQGASNVGVFPIDYNNDGKMDFVQRWNNNGKLNLFLYKSDGQGFTFVSNTQTQLGYSNLAYFQLKVC